MSCHNVQIWVQKEVPTYCSICSFSEVLIYACCPKTNRCFLFWKFLPRLHIVFALLKYLHSLHVNFSFTIHIWMKFKLLLVGQSRSESSGRYSAILIFILTSSFICDFSLLSAAVLPCSECGLSLICQVCSVFLGTAFLVGKLISASRWRLLTLIV